MGTAEPGLLGDGEERAQNNQERERGSDLDNTRLGLMKRVCKLREERLLLCVINVMGYLLWGYVM